MKGKEENLEEAEHEEHKVGPEGSKDEMLGNSCNDNNFSSSSNVLFKVEVNLGIPMFNGQTNAEALDNWLNSWKFTLVFIKSKKHNKYYFPV
jgi:hypothetical protein